ncbi:uncharacterized protein PG998_004267 [Apiospora kogelbergensis]|uniref:uncharacterized protein n=1 Tax=Apiospora kogelbergensis TaxID=1337665 RepID=UPI00313295E8
MEHVRCPHPAMVVNVETESDVAITVKYCASKGIPFVAQNGGVGWAATFDLGAYGVLIDLARLNQVTFNADKTRATIGGGARINETIAHASAAGALVETGNCNCVGALGAILGGGYGNLMGLYGFGVDNVVSMRVVTADGRIRDVTAASDADLFWALRGAGPNLGIVTSAVVKSYPVSQAGMLAWTGSLIFTPDKLEQVVQAIQDLELKPEMNIFLYFGTPPRDGLPLPVYMPSGRPRIAQPCSPTSRGTRAVTAFALPGGRKPSYTVAMQNLVPSTWRQVWDKYVEFQKLPTAENSVVLMEAYSLTKARSFGSGSAAFSHRDVNFNAVIILWYSDVALDDRAQVVGKAARDLWKATDGLARDATYINFAHGDEPLDVVYGDSLSRLRDIKHRIDPKDNFNQWFNIK